MKAFVLGLSLAALPILSLTPAAFAGGETSGGGNTSARVLLEPKDIAEAVAQSKTFLQLWIRRTEITADRDRQELLRSPGNEYYEERKTLHDKLFATGKADIFEVLAKGKVELRSERPCYDKDGTETDASIYSELPGAVCVSVPRLQKKLLIKDNVYITKITGLVFHEFTHLVGMNEEDAYALQDEVERAAAKMQDSYSNYAPASHQYLADVLFITRKSEKVFGLMMEHSCADIVFGDPVDLFVKAVLDSSDGYLLGKGKELYPLRLKSYQKLQDIYLAGPKKTFLPLETMAHVTCPREFDLSTLSAEKRQWLDSELQRQAKIIQDIKAEVESTFGKDSLTVDGIKQLDFEIVSVK